ncbi:hypothetical protein A2U01_0044931, partial [Trifolium medium]|nr:hypothetical protein [Trifolium medium]
MASSSLHGCCSVLDWQ